MGTVPRPRRRELHSSTTASTSTLATSLQPGCNCMSQGLKWCAVQKCRGELVGVACTPFPLRCLFTLLQKRPRDAQRRLASASPGCPLPAQLPGSARTLAAMEKKELYRKQRGCPAITCMSVAVQCAARRTRHAWAHPAGTCPSTPVHARPPRPRAQASGSQQQAARAPAWMTSCRATCCASLRATRRGGACRCGGARALQHCSAHATARMPHRPHCTSDPAAHSRAQPPACLKPTLARAPP